MRLSWDELIGYPLMGLYAFVGTFWLVMHATQNQALCTLIVIFYINHKLKG